MNFLIDITMNDNDKKLLIILLVLMILLFVLLGLIGMGIRKVNSSFAKRMDYEIHDALIYRVIQDEKHLKKYGMKKNRRVFMKQATPAILIALASLLLYVISSTISHSWAENYFGRFGTLLFVFDFSDPDCYVTFWNLRLLAKWPPLVSSPHWVNEYWASYLLVPLWITSSMYYLVVVQAFLSRLLMLNKRVKTVFDKSLDDFNFYDGLATPSNPEPFNKENKPTPNK